ncbi:MAG TPA: acyl-CoA dehydrogenase family protein [Stellaceae bacterium]|nr:acyl-CoA dehydrogenase family protein [Stellaceae bacterium]
MSEMRPVLAATAERLFAAHGGRDAAIAPRGAWPAALWQALEAAGLTLASVAEDKGGAGVDRGDVAVILRAAGRHAAPVPLAETMLAAWLLSESGIAVPPGPLALAPMLREDAAGLRIDGTRRLAGTARGIPWARDCVALAVLARGPHGDCVALVPRAAARIEPSRNLAGEPRDTVAFDDVTLAADQVAPAGAGIDLDALWLRGALVRISSMAGALETVLDSTVRHANERVQFGRPIAKFQAVQQQIAVLAANVAAAGAAADAAAHDGADVAIAAAKARIGEAASLACGIAHQVHGAMGFTQEHALHRCTTRLWAWREEFGDETHWWAWLGREAARQGGDGLWPFVTAAATRAGAR